MQPLVSVYRGDLLESFHTGSIAVVDSSGRLLAYAGDPGSETFLRSAAKPFQALPLLVEGAAEEYDLTSEEIALICASHGGEPHHVATAAAILRKGEFDEADLLCGVHLPYDEKAAAELRQSGEPPSVLQNNCSGKHAGMLLATTLMDASSTSYIDSGHPLQLQVRQTIGEFSGLAPERIQHAIDGCGAPSFYLSLYRTAYAYARLVATAQNLGEPAGLPRYQETARQVSDAMTSHPEYVAGAWSMTTDLIKAFDGLLLAKEGAEGFYAMGIHPSLNPQLTPRLDLGEDICLGVALKINDGSMGRGRNPAILRVLELLGLKVDNKPSLQPYWQRPVENYSGRIVGRIEAAFRLEFL